jgi:hypothetical protein
MQIGTIAADNPRIEIGKDRLAVRRFREGKRKNEGRPLAPTAPPIPWTGAGFPLPIRPSLCVNDVETAILRKFRVEGAGEKSDDRPQPYRAFTDNC